MKDQKNAACLRTQALDLSINLLKTLKTCLSLSTSEEPTPINDAIVNAEAAAVLIACEVLNTDVEQAEEYVSIKTTVTD